MSLSSVSVIANALRLRSSVGGDSNLMFGRTGSC